MSTTFGNASPTASRTSTVATVGCLLFFGLFWTVFVLGFDGVIFWNSLRQIRASGFPKTTGVVTKSSVESHRGSKGRITYSAAIEYSYSVAEKQYRGKQYRFGQTSSTGGNAQEIVAAFPVGRKVAVFYSPDDPATAVLKPGLEGTDLFMAMFLMPFNFVMLGIWYCIGISFFGGRRPIVAGGAKIIDDGYTTRVRLSGATPLAVGLGVIGVGSFVCIFAIGFTEGFNPPLMAMCVQWVSLLGCGIFAAAIWAMKLARGDQDLIINETNQMMTLPRTCGRREPELIPMKKVRAIDVEQQVKPRAGAKANMAYTPTLVYDGADGATRRAAIKMSSRRIDAESLAEWLRERLRLKRAEGVQ